MLEDLDDLMAEYGCDALFLEGLSIHNTDLFYVTKFLAVDKAYYVKVAGQPPILAATDLVCERAQRHSPMKNFYTVSPIWEQAVRDRLSREELDQLIINNIARKLIPSNSVVGIPRNTDAVAVIELNNSGLIAKPVQDLFLQARETKSVKELQAIQKASRATEATFERVIEFFQNAKVGSNNVLLHNGVPITVGNIKHLIEHSLVDNDSENSQESIVAGGIRGADFHYLGQREDRLRANEPIIVDIYPRRLEERFHADITRTIVRGNVSSKLQKMFEAVESALDAVIDSIRIGGTTEEMVNTMSDSFERDGYPSANRNPEIKEGMLHGLGHGIGLDVHELPFLSPLPYPLRENAAIAIEPGLYYKRIGGVRIEDDVIITKRGARRITRLPRTYFL
ncbi:MAG: M24 family metallopeptidase [Promethearchaeota archaeon]